jgi:hypothetical protein
MMASLQRLEFRRGTLNICVCCGDRFMNLTVQLVKPILEMVSVILSTVYAQTDGAFLVFTWILSVTAATHMVTVGTHL